MNLDRHSKLIRSLLCDTQDPQTWMALAEYFSRQSQNWEALLCFEQAYVLKPSSFELARKVDQFIRQQEILENTPLRSADFICEEFICLKCGSFVKEKFSFICSCGGLLGPTLKRASDIVPVYPMLAPRYAFLSTDRRYLLVNLYHACALFGEAIPGQAGEEYLWVAQKENEYRPLLDIYTVPFYPWLVYYGASSKSESFQDIYFQFMAHLGIYATTVSPMGNQTLLAIRVPTFKPNLFQIEIQEQVLRWPLKQVVFQRDLTPGDARLPDFLSIPSKNKNGFEWDFEQKCFKLVTPEENILLPEAFPNQELFQPFPGKKIQVDYTSPSNTIDGYHSTLWTAPYKNLPSILLNNAHKEFTLGVP